MVGATDAKFNVGQQISDLEQMIARKPDVIFSIPIDPQIEMRSSYKKAAAAGTKLVFLDGTDSRSTLAPLRLLGHRAGRLDQKEHCFFAADELAKAIGGKGKVGILTLVYDCCFSVAICRGE